MSESILNTDNNIDFKDVETLVINNLRMTLKPIISNFEMKTEKYRALSIAVKELPEFQKIIEENADLKNEIYQLKLEASKERIGLKIIEKNTYSDHDKGEFQNIINDDEPIVVKEENTESRFDAAINNGDVFSISDDDNCVSETISPGNNVIKNELQSEIKKIKLEADLDNSHKNKDASVNEEEVDEDEEEVDEDEEEVDEDEEEVDEDEEEVDEDEEEEEEDEEDEEEEDEEDEEDEEEEEVKDDNEEETEEEEEEVKDENEEETVEEEDEKEMVDENNASGSEDDEGDEEEVFMIEIEAVNYYTNDDNNGDIYKILDDEEIGEKVGYFKDGEPYI